MNASTLAKTAADLEEHTEILRDPTYYSRGPGPDVMDAASLTGDHVVNAAGEHLGRIEAIMLDVRSGRIAYAVLSFGGFLGIHDKLFAIPWSALTLDAVHKRFVLDVAKERLEEALQALIRVRELAAERRPRRVERAVLEEDVGRVGEEQVGEHVLGARVVPQLIEQLELEPRRRGVLALEGQPGVGLAHDGRQHPACRRQRGRCGVDHSGVPQRERAAGIRRRARRA